MYKEIIICLIVLVIVMLLNITTQNSTKSSVLIVTDELDSLRKVVIDEKVNESNEIIDKILNIWDAEYEKLSYYIEHNELEKVKVELVELKANIEVEQFKEATGNIDRAIYLLEHIKQKTELQVKNIF